MKQQSNDDFLSYQLQDAESLLHRMEKNVVFELIQHLRKHRKHLTSEEQQQFSQLLLDWKRFLLRRYFPLSFRLAEEAGFVQVPPEEINKQYRRLMKHQWPANDSRSIDNFLNDEKTLLSVLRTPSLRKIPIILLSDDEDEIFHQPNDHLILMYNPEAPDKNWATLALHLRKDTNEAVTAELKYSEGITKMDMFILLASLFGVYISIIQEEALNFLQKIIQDASGTSISISFPELIGITGMLILFLKMLQILIGFMIGKRRIGRLITKNKKVMKSRLDSSTTLIMLSYYQRKRKASWARAVFKVIIDRNGADLDEIQKELSRRWEIFRDWKTLQKFVSRLEALEWIFQDNTGTWKVPRGKVIEQPDHLLDDQLKDSFDLPMDLQSAIRDCHARYQDIRTRFEELAMKIQQRVKSHS